MRFAQSPAQTCHGPHTDHRPSTAQYESLQSVSIAAPYPQNKIFWPIQSFNRHSYPIGNYRRYSRIHPRTQYRRMSPVLLTNPRHTHQRPIFCCRVVPFIVEETLLLAFQHHGSTKRVVWRCGVGRPNTIQVKMTAAWQQITCWWKKSVKWLTICTYQWIQFHRPILSRVQRATSQRVPFFRPCNSVLEYTHWYPVSGSHPVRL